MVSPQHRWLTDTIGAAVFVALGENPVRAEAAEALVGQPPSAAAFAAVAAHIAERSPNPLSDLYASGEFRVHLSSASRA